MSSMVKHLISTTALILPAFVMAAAVNAQPTEWRSGIGNGQMALPSAQIDQSQGNIPAALQRWRMLSQSGNYSFDEYASFLMTYPGWPGDKVMRQNAEQAINLLSYSPSQAVAYFDRLEPVSNTGRAKYAIALAATGDNVRAENWARRAWREGPLTDDDEARILSMMSAKLTTEDYDTRTDKLLWVKATRAAERVRPYTSVERRAGFSARISLKNGYSDADGYLNSMGRQANADAGVLADRAVSLRTQGKGWAARELLANRDALVRAPADTEKWYETLLSFAREAAAEGQSDVAYKIASRVDDGIPAGSAVRDMSIGVRDDYTSLTWLAGTLALDKLNRPKDAIVTAKLQNHRKHGQKGPIGQV
jgi:soluble lytic murein transglycosylase